ncbi:hypothetical protein [Arhodomonas aquaeolei]|uniref:hypothetical protein n=1 Tax=Arhodomonas aquaeolei TaxID=2369 RepID=UPI0003677860|nr:hypothetical protein [Arhodomonas aquaeolei]
MRDDQYEEHTSVQVHVDAGIRTSPAGNGMRPIELPCRIRRWRDTGRVAMEYLDTDGGTVPCGAATRAGVHGRGVKHTLINSRAIGRSRTVDDVVAAVANQAGTVVPCTLAGDGPSDRSCRVRIRARTGDGKTVHHTYTVPASQLRQADDGSWWLASWVARERLDTYTDRAEEPIDERPWLGTEALRRQLHAQVEAIRHEEAEAAEAERQRREKAEAKAKAKREEARRQRERDREAAPEPKPDPETEREKENEKWRKILIRLEKRENVAVRIYGWRPSGSGYYTRTQEDVPACDLYYTASGKSVYIVEDDDYVGCRRKALTNVEILGAAEGAEQ